MYKSREVMASIAFLNMTRRVVVRLEVRVYSFLPRMSMISWDNVASVSFFERGRSISASRRTIVSLDTPLGQIR